MYDTVSSSDKKHFQALGRHRAWTTESQEGQQQSSHLLLTTVVRAPLWAGRGRAPRITPEHSKNVNEIIKQNGYQHKKKKRRCYLARSRNSMCVSRLTCASLESLCSMVSWPRRLWTKHVCFSLRPVPQGTPSELPITDPCVWLWWFFL